MLCRPINTRNQSYSHTRTHVDDDVVLSSALTKNAFLLFHINRHSRTYAHLKIAHVCHLFNTAEWNRNQCGIVCRDSRSYRRAFCIVLCAFTYLLQLSALFGRNASTRCAAAVASIRCVSVPVAGAVIRLQSTVGWRRIAAVAAAAAATIRVHKRRCRDGRRCRWNGRRQSAGTRSCRCRWTGCR